MTTKDYFGVSDLTTYGDRLKYLQLFDNNPGNDRYFMNAFYKSKIWRRLRREVILRDNGCDMGIPGMEIEGEIIVHHIVPITEEDYLSGSPLLTDLNNLICVSISTHNKIHFEQKEEFEMIERYPGDTKLW